MPLHVLVIHCYFLNFYFVFVKSYSICWSFTSLFFHSLSLSQMGPLWVSLFFVSINFLSLLFSHISAKDQLEKHPLQSNSLPRIWHGGLRIFSGIVWSFITLFTETSLSGTVQYIDNSISLNLCQHTPIFLVCAKNLEEVKESGSDNILVSLILNVKPICTVFNSN